MILCVSIDAYIQRRDKKDTHHSINSGCFWVTVLGDVGNMGEVCPSLPKFSFLSIYYLPIEEKSKRLVPLGHLLSNRNFIVI